MLKPDEKELLVQIKNADHSAFRQFFDRYVQKIYYYIYGYIKNKQVAEDLTQDVFKKVWEKKALLDEHKSLSGFLFTLCYHCVMDYYREKNVPVTGILTEDMLYSLKEPDTHHTIHYKQLQSLYQQAVDLLPPKRKEVYLLSRHEGLSNREIAERLNISVKTVENQMTATLHFIRNFFQKAGYLIILLIGN